MSKPGEQLKLFDLDTCAGKTCPELFPPECPTAKTSASSSRKQRELLTAEYQCLDLREGYGNLLGPYWDINSPSLGEYWTLNTGPAPRSGGGASSLSQILEATVPFRYYLSRTACLGILRRSETRGKELPPQLKAALITQAETMDTLSSGTNESSECCAVPTHLKLYTAIEAAARILIRKIKRKRINDDGTDRNDAPGIEKVTVFAANQRDEVRDLNDIAGALQAQPGMKQQTFVAMPQDNCLTPWDNQSKRIFDTSGTWQTLYGSEGGGRGFISDEAVPRNNCLTPWDTQQGRIFTPEGNAPTLAGADGAGGRNPAGLLFSAGVITKGNGECILTPEKHTSLTSGGGQAGQGYPCVLTAGFCAGAAPTAGGIGYQEECAPTLKGSSSGTNMVPSIICLNDQGGQRMDVYENMTGTLRAQMDGHPPLVMTDNPSGEPAINKISSVLYGNHGIDSRYTGPHEVAPTMSARYGTGGNNVPLISQEDETYCIAGNIIGREDENGGNGFGFQPGISYTVTATDRHAIYARQRSDIFQENEVTATQSARQHKDATDLVMDVAGLDCRNASENGDLCGTLQSKTTGGYSLNNVHPVRTGNLIRRLIPLECERLQGFPDYWTDIGGSDSARYKALGNSVAIPCVDFVLRGIAYFLLKQKETEDREKTLSAATFDHGGA